MAGEAQVSTRDVAQPPLAAPADPPFVAASEPPTVPIAPTPLFTTDDKGFVNTDARCDGTQTVVALGRTAGSFVVICGETDGGYEYRGVRLSDAAVLKTVAENAPSRGFVARKSGVLYAVSPTELLVTAGDAVIKQEPMLEFRGPR
jgi:hypothetical protein